MTTNATCSMIGCETAIESGANYCDGCNRMLAATGRAVAGMRRTRGDGQ